MEDTETWAGNLKLVGTALCLDFANTTEGRTSDGFREYLASYADLVAWSRHANILTEHTAQHLLHEAARRPAEAAMVLDRAIALREAIYRVFFAVAQEHPPALADLDILNAALADALSHLRVVPLANGFGWTWADDADALDQMLWPVARSAADLLTEGELRRVRECAGDTCGWLFVDTSKNRSRRWCDMQDCGNVAKVRRYRKRQQTPSSV